MLGHSEKALGKRPAIHSEATSPPKILGLPRELLAIIFQYVRSRRTLEALAQTCTVFNLCVTPVLYREVKFRSTLSWAQFVQTLLRASNSRPFGKFVQALDLSGSPEDARNAPGTSSASAANPVRAIIQQPSYSARNPRFDIVLVFSNIYAPPSQPVQPAYDPDTRTLIQERFSTQSNVTEGFGWARVPHHNANVVGTAALPYAFCRTPIRAITMVGNDVPRRGRWEQVVRRSFGSSTSLGSQIRPPVSDTMFGMMDSDAMLQNIDAVYDHPGLMDVEPPIPTASTAFSGVVNFEIDIVDAILAADSAIWSNADIANLANFQHSVTYNPGSLRAALSNRVRTALAEPTHHQVLPSGSVSSSSTTQTNQMESELFFEEEYEDMITANGSMDTTLSTTLMRPEQSPRSPNLPKRTPTVPIKHVSAASLCQIAAVCPNLKSLNLARSHVEPDTRILETGDYLSQLMYTPDTELTHVRVSAADALRCVLDACPGLVNLDLSGCAWVDASVVEAVLAERKGGGSFLRGLNLMDCVCVAGGLRKLYVVGEAEELRDLVLGSLG